MSGRAAVSWRILAVDVFVVRLTALTLSVTATTSLAVRKKLTVMEPHLAQGGRGTRSASLRKVPQSEQ